FGSTAQNEIFEDATQGADKPIIERKSPARTDLYGDPLPEGPLARMGTVRLRHQSNNGFSTAISPDGTMIVTGSYDSLRFWESSTGKLIRQIKENYQQGRLVFAPNGEWLAVQSAPDTVSLL